MSAESTIYELEISPGRVVRFREMPAQEFSGLMSAVAKDSNPDWELIQRGLRLSIVSDGQTPLEFKLLQGPLLEQRFRTRELIMLRRAWQSVHMPSDEDDARVKAMRVVVD